MVITSNLIQSMDWILQKDDLDADDSSAQFTDRFLAQTKLVSQLIAYSWLNHGTRSRQVRDVFFYPRGQYRDSQISDDGRLKCLLAGDIVPGSEGSNSHWQPFNLQDIQQDESAKAFGNNLEQYKEKWNVEGIFSNYELKKVYSIEVDRIQLVGSLNEFANPGKTQEGQFIFRVKLPYPAPSSFVETNDLDQWLNSNLYCIHSDGKNNRYCIDVDTIKPPSPYIPQSTA